MHIDADLQGTLVDATVRIAPQGQPINGADIVVHVDPEQLEPIVPCDPDALGLQPAAAPFEQALLRDIDPALGRVRYVAGTTQKPYPTSDFDLVHMRFGSKAAGTFRIAVSAVDSNANFAGENLLRHIHHAAVHIESPNMPPDCPQLASPEAGRTMRGRRVEFQWHQAFDPDGDPVRYRLVVASQADFADPITVSTQAASFAGVGSLSWVAMLLSLVAVCGYAKVAPLSQRGRLILCLVLLLGVTSCFSGGSEQRAGGTAPAMISAELSNLAPGTYFWKVIAVDAQNEETESQVRQFTLVADGLSG